MRLFRRLAAFDHDGFDFAGASPAEDAGVVVFGRIETSDALLERRKLDDDKAMELVRTSMIWKRPPRASTRPPYLAMMAGTRSVYFLYSTGSVMRERATQ